MLLRYIRLDLGLRVALEEICQSLLWGNSITIYPEYGDLI